MEIYNHLILGLYGAAQECTPTEFSEQALSQLKTALHFDSGVMMNIDVVGGDKLTIRSMHLSNQPLEQLLAWDQLETPDYVLDAAFRQRGATLTNISRDTFGAHADFMDYCHRFEIAHTLIQISQPLAPNSVDLMSLWRARPEQRYVERDRKLSDLLLPHVFQASRVSRRLFDQPDAGPPQHVSVLASLHGCLHTAPADAITLLQREWREWSPPLLPPQLMRQLASSQQLLYNGDHIVVKAETLGPALHLQIAQRPATKLTAAEWNVAQLAAQGLSYKDIARQLDNSPATVRNQLHSVYNKLGVENKTQLAALWPAVMPQTLS
ncbi:helix-turn-helix transcriptional regulator [Duganella sp. sic0402]|uniref:helix-turn-helix transcriptional regulator n=1 Tax=Duganella sp. sic0402 TaxID=2854786 RepID=UPI001C491986|nr:helix-turn-helix transcriptional regulator [Duganella sp. sic0402]MBV7536589.1 helix-turn-helix transcriptional regulator [Duganella sp. sic0402]